MIRVVKSAEIEIIKPSKLRVGDFILQKNWKREVIRIYELNKFIVVSNPIDNTTESLPLYLNYYKIISCEEEDIDEIS